MFKLTTSLLHGVMSFVAFMEMARMENEKKVPTLTLLNIIKTYSTQFVIIKKCDDICGKKHDVHNSFTTLPRLIILIFLMRLTALVPAGQGAPRGDCEIMSKFRFLPSLNIDCGSPLQKLK